MWKWLQRFATAKWLEPCSTVLFNREENTHKRRRRDAQSRLEATQFLAAYMDQRGSQQYNG